MTVRVFTFPLEWERKQHYKRHQESTNYEKASEKIAKIKQTVPVLKNTAKDKTKAHITHKNNYINGGKRRGDI